MSAKIDALPSIETLWMRLHELIGPVLSENERLYRRVFYAGVASALGELGKPRPAQDSTRLAYQWVSEYRDHVVALEEGRE